MVFLDVNMKEMDGVETAQIIRMLSDNVYIIFITAYITYATAGYKVNAIRYLLKNDKNLEISLKECIDTIIDKMHYTEEWIEFEFQNGKRKLPIDRILYVESQLHKLMFFILENGIKEYYMYDKMDKIERILNNKGFYRIHQSFLVNMKYVKMIERYKAVLIEGSEISISKKYYKSAEREYLKMKGEI
jgi:DNA-binding LytR/AlgR family response regulator